MIYKLIILVASIFMIYEFTKSRSTAVAQVEPRLVEEIRKTPSGDIKITRIENLPNTSDDNRSVPTAQIFSPYRKETSYVTQIINAINENKVIVPDHFQNNIAWVKTGAITHQAFLDAYYYLANQGIIHVAKNYELTPTPSKTGLGAWFFSTPTESGAMISDSTPFDLLTDKQINTNSWLKLNGV